MHLVTRICVLFVVLLCAAEILASPPVKHSRIEYSGSFESGKADYRLVVEEDAKTNRLTLFTLFVDRRKIPVTAEAFADVEIDLSTVAITQSGGDPQFFEDGIVITTSNGALYITFEAWSKDCQTQVQRIPQYVRILVDTNYNYEWSLKHYCEEP